MPESASLSRLPDVIAKTGLKRASLYKKIKQGQFPRPIQLGSGSRSVAWIDSEIDQWIAERIREARGGAGGAQ